MASVGTRLVRGWRASGGRLSHGVNVPRMACGAPWAEEWQREYRGQLTPSRSDSAEPASDPLERQMGPYKSRWFRIRSHARVEDVVAVVEDAENGAEAAVYAGIPEDCAQCGPIVAALRKRGFSFHHFMEGGESEGNGLLQRRPGEFIYYKWAVPGPDMVPSYATAVEGVGVLVFSPEKNAVLLVWEHGHWKIITGNVDARESVVDAARREVGEEVGLDLQEGFQMLGGWQAPASLDQCVNSVFTVLQATAVSHKAQVDGIEIEFAQWFPLSLLPTAQDAESAPPIEGRPFGMRWDLGDHGLGRNMISRTVARFLEVHRAGRGLDITPARSNASDQSYVSRNWFSASL